MNKLVINEPLSLDGLLEKYQDDKAGGQVIFCGRVRNHHKSKPVGGLEYTSYEPMASNMIQKIVDKAIELFGLHNAYCIHREGKVSIGGIAVIVVTSASHREEAYKANRYILDRVKYEVPIWKKEFFSDGTIEWGKNSEQVPEFVENT